MSDVFHAPPTVSASLGHPSVSETYEAERGDGWVTFASVMMLILGIMNVLYGIAAIDSANFYVQDAKYVLADLNTWGWVLLAVGVVQFAAAIGIWLGSQLGRWIGVTAAGVNAMTQMLFIDSHPFLALALFSVDVLVIYGLIVYGGRRTEV